MESFDEVVRHEITLWRVVEAGTAQIPVGRIHALEQIAQTHRDLEAGIVGSQGAVVITPATR